MLSRADKGFALLESMVAIVLLSSVGIAVYGLINTNMISLERVASVSAQTPKVYAALNYFESVNIGDELLGEFSVPGANVTWKAKLISPYREALTGAGYRGYYRIGLYQVVLTIADEGGGSLGTYEILKAGYQKVRSSDDS